MRGTPQERFFAKVEQPANGAACWVWMASCDPSGYGHFFFRGVLDGAHRAAWILFRGEISDGLFALHKCDNPRCVNPDHLFLGTHQDNADDKMAKGRHTGANKTHCKRGHPLSPDNVYMTKAKTGYRRACKDCLRLRGRVYDARRGWRRVAA